MSPVLAATTQPSESESHDAFNDYLALEGFDTAQATFKRTMLGGSVSVESAYTASMPTTIAQVFGMKSIPYTVTSSAGAPLHVSEISVKMKQAYGWFNKEVHFKAESLDGTVETLATLTYTMTDSQAYGWRGTGTTVISRRAR